MAVPRRGHGNGVMEDEVEEEGLFEEVEGVDEFDDEYYHYEQMNLVGNLGSDPPPHLRQLTQAAQLGNVDSLRLALDNLTNGSVNDPVEDGDTVLHLSCLYGYKSCVQLLLERGASLEVEDEEGAIPLHDACAGGFTEIVQLLIDSASDGDCLKRMLAKVDSEGDTPLHHAARGEHLDVVRLLLSVGADPRKANFDGKTPAELSDPETEVKSVLMAAMSTGVPASFK